MGQTALVTGASGFIGSRLVEELASHGFQVRALMRRSSLDHNLRGLAYTRVEGDLADRASLDRALAGVTHVFHLAGALTAASREDYFRQNAEGTANLAQAAAGVAGQLERFVYVSSLAAGGPKDRLELRTEGEPDQPVSAYGKSKLEGERALLAFRDRFPVLIIRPPMVYGPRDQATFLFVRTVARNLVPSLGLKYYSVIHVNDLCRGIAQAGGLAGKAVPSGEVFYLAADDLTTYDGLMGTIARELKRRPIRVRVPVALIGAAAAGLTIFGRLTRRTFHLNLDKMNEIRPDYWICSNEKAKRVLGFRPEFDLNTGMADAIQWYRREGWV